MLSSLIVFATISFVTKVSYGHDSSSTVKLYNILLKPFGVRLLQDSDIYTKIPWNSLNCTGHLSQLRACNFTLLSFLANTTSREDTLVDSMLERCGSGRYKCLQQQVSGSGVLREWFERFKVTLHQMCRDKCWETSLAVGKDCIHSKTESMTTEFAGEVLGAFCHKPESVFGEASYCTGSFVEGLFSKNIDKEECNVAKAIEERRCSSSCYQEISDFYHSLGFCVSVVIDTMKKYSVVPSENTFGVIVQNSTVMCGKNKPRKSMQPTRSSHRIATTVGKNQTNHTTMQSPLSGSSSLNGKLIAAIVVAVLVFGIAGAVLCRYLYQRIINKPKLRFEDYGYSHLQMMLDQDDFYYNNGDDDDDHGLLDL